MTHYAWLSLSLVSQLIQWLGEIISAGIRQYRCLCFAIRLVSHRHCDDSLRFPVVRPIGGLPHEQAGQWFSVFQCVKDLASKLH